MLFLFNFLVSNVRLGVGSVVLCFSKLSFSLESV